MVVHVHHTPTLCGISIKWVASVRPEGTAPTDLSEQEQVCPQILMASITHEGLGFLDMIFLHPLNPTSVGPLHSEPSIVNLEAKPLKHMNSLGKSLISIHIRRCTYARLSRVPRVPWTPKPLNP